MPAPTIKRLTRSALTTVLTTATMTATTAPATAAWRHKHPAARQGRYRHRYNHRFNNRLQFHDRTLIFNREKTPPLYQCEQGSKPRFTQLYSPCTTAKHL